MTTEVAILNKSAVALAADSAVTIATRTGDSHRVTKIYAEANKLFELVKGQPVGVMIYNSADIAGIPWETLIKVYRHRNPAAEFPTLEEYADHFIAFVGAALAPLMTEEDERAELIDSFVPLADRLYDTFKPQIVAVQGRVQRREKFGELLDELETVLDGPSTTVAKWAEGLNEGELWSRWGSDLTECIASKTGEFTLTKPVRQRFARLVLRAFLRWPTAQGTWSGLVISGFGADDMFPTVCHAEIGGFLEGRLVKVASTVDSVTNATPALIRPYAQTSEALMFLQGIDPEVSGAVSNFWARWSRDLENDAIEIIKKESQVSAPHLEAIRQRLSTHFKTSWQSFGNFMNEEFHLRRLEPIEGSAAFLSKREIADLAENLVDLTSLRNRVSLDRQETVGGATDVAVISKGDGFVWVKRKHYFERDRNPAWATRQALTDVLSRLQDMAEGEDAE
ncbi:hypothetical protein [Mumia sp. DW29H23]|uniref:hypothetical protein n=1 Tax=Mumia sp. DW29H23 TaxID=3421241 RepID=UPI003D684CA0